MPDQIHIVPKWPIRSVKVTINPLAGLVIDPSAQGNYFGTAYGRMAFERKPSRGHHTAMNMDLVS